MRNVIKQADKAKELILDKQDLTAGELQQLFDILRPGKTVTSDSAWECICTAFYFGFMVGFKQTN